MKIQEGISRRSMKDEANEEDANDVMDCAEDDEDEGPGDDPARNDEDADQNEGVAFLASSQIAFEDGDIDCSNLLEASMKYLSAKHNINPETCLHIDEEIEASAK